MRGLSHLSSPSKTGYMFHWNWEVWPGTKFPSTSTQMLELEKAVDWSLRYLCPHGPFSSRVTQCPSQGPSQVPHSNDWLLCLHPHPLEDKATLESLLFLEVMKSLLRPLAFLN